MPPVRILLYLDTCLLYFIPYYCIATPIVLNYTVLNKTNIHGCSPLIQYKDQIEGRVVVYDGEMYDAPLMHNCIMSIVALGLLFTKWAQGKYYN